MITLRLFRNSSATNLVYLDLNFTFVKASRAKEITLSTYNFREAINKKKHFCWLIKILFKFKAFIHQLLYTVRGEIKTKLEIASLSKILLPMKVHIYIIKNVHPENFFDRTLYGDIWWCQQWQKMYLFFDNLSLTTGIFLGTILRAGFPKGQIMYTFPIKNCISRAFRLALTRLTTKYSMKHDQNM
jgi:hypothetical protein